jgi:hypothetical protein
MSIHDGTARRSRCAPEREPNGTEDRTEQQQQAARQLQQRLHIPLEEWSSTCRRMQELIDAHTPVFSYSFTILFTVFFKTTVATTWSELNCQTQRASGKPDR